MEVEVIGGAAPPPRPPPDRKAIRPNPVAVGFIEEEMLAVFLQGWMRGGNESGVAQGPGLLMTMEPVIITLT